MRERRASGADMEIRAIRCLDHEFARWLADNFEVPADQRDVLVRLATAVSYCLHLKHVCLDLDMFGELENPLLDELLRDIDAARVRTLDSRAVGVAGENVSAPLLRSEDGRRIWLQKYYAFESAVQARFAASNARPVDLDEEELQMDLQNLYGDRDPDQRVAVATALKYRLAIITGGPGTGKTYTVARILALLWTHAGESNLRVALAAPTGKAANRMFQSLQAALGDPGIKGRIAGMRLPEKASTLHALLKIRRGSPQAGHRAGKPLAVDVLIVDEASMIDLPMMYRLLEALPERARLILLGDKDQLASVEAGSVLGGLCAGAPPWLATLTESRRFRERPEIGTLAAAIMSEPPALPDFSANQYVLFRQLGADTDPWQPPWLETVSQYFRRQTERLYDGWPVDEILSRQSEMQVLCALREGPYGVEGINRMVQWRLGKSLDSWYAGCPVMVLSNDHPRGLFNGDIGLVLPVAETPDGWVIEQNPCQARLRACFLAEGGRVKAISRTQMPSWESCYAITIHKSQGSEYHRVVLVLPADPRRVQASPVLSRELIYTGVTRASESLEIWAGEGVLEAALQCRTVRMSGLY